eukprot:4251666-Ditylum_brightwellii.AAC.1
MLADLDTNPIGGSTLKRKIDRIIDTKYCPPQNSDHYKLLFNAPEVSVDNLLSSKKATSSKLYSNVNTRDGPTLFLVSK